METIKKYKLLTKHPKDEFIDLNVGVKLDSHQVTRFLNEQDKYIEKLETQNKRVLEKLELITKSNQELEQENYFLKEKNKSLIDEEEHISKKMQEVGFDNIEDLCKSQKELQDYTENTANLIDKLTEDSVFASTQLAIEELKKLKENAWQSATDISQLIDYTELAKIVDNQIKELKGEK